MRTHLHLELPRFLALLDGFTNADDLLEALSTGPLRRFGPMGSALWCEQDGMLTLQAASGIAQLAAPYFQQAPLDDGPGATAYIASEVVVEPTAAYLAERHHALAVAAGDDPRLRAALGGTTVFVPIVSHGLSIGLLGVQTAGPIALETLDVAYLDAIGSTLGLWLTHPMSPLLAGTSETSSRTDAIDLSARQRAILRLVLEGHSNAAIAVHLSCSVSTVKQEVQRVQRMTHTLDRTSAAERAWELGQLH